MRETAVKRISFFLEFVMSMRSIGSLHSLFCEFLNEIYIFQTTATIITRGASLILIGFLCATLALFGTARIWDPSRVLHVNMEISLLLAHLCLLPAGFHDSSPEMCTFISILVHFFFLACFTFMFLESLHLYALVGWVVKSNGIMSRWQNTFFGK